MARKRLNEAIVGDGPAAAVLSCYLSRGGIKNVIFSSGKRPELIVGESLVPAVMPILKELGLEETVRAFSVFKPGANFYIKDDVKTIVRFNSYSGCLEKYAYNVPRDKFDKALIDHAAALGAKIIERKAEPRLNERGLASLGNDDEEILKDYFGEGQVFYVDATGRSRLFSKKFGIGAEKGGRNDLALFTHWDKALFEDQGHIHINRIKYGWSWRIPLPSKASVGIVVNPKHLVDFGENIGEQYRNFIANDPLLREFVSGAVMIGPVMKYTNYQLVSDRFFGANWALTGDSAGFVDPIFSSGLNLALNGAKDLSDVLSRGAERSALSRYEAVCKRRFYRWQQIVESFYDGRLFGLIRAGNLSAEIFPWNFLMPAMRRNLEKVFSGMVSPDSASFYLARNIIKLKHASKFGSRLAVR